MPPRHSGRHEGDSPIPIAFSALDMVGAFIVMVFFIGDIL